MHSRSARSVSARVTLMVLLSVAIAACGSRPIVSRLYLPGAARFQRIGSAAVVRMTAGAPVEMESISVAQDGLGITAWGELVLTTKRRLAGVRVTGVGTLRAESGDASLALMQSLSGNTATLFEGDVNLQDGIGVIGSIPLSKGTYRLVLEIPSDQRSPERRRGLCVTPLWGEEEEPGSFQLQMGGESRPGLLLTAGTVVTCDIPRGGEWSLETGLASPASASGPGVLEVHVAAPKSGEPAAVLVAHTLTWEDTLVRLPRVAEDSQLWLRCTRGELLLGAPVIVRRSARTLCERVPRSVLLVSMDTVRADHVPPWSSAQLSPGLTEWVRNAVVFDRAVCQAPVTDASHQCIFTGLHVPRHGGGGRVPIAEGIPMLAAVLAAHGQRTAAFTDGGLVSAVFGFADGFERYWEYQGSPRNKEHLGEITERCFDWLSGLDQRDPWFAFVHSYQAHSPYMNHRTRSWPTVSIHGRQKRAPLQSLLQQVVPLSRNRSWTAEELLLIAKRNYRSEVQYLDETLLTFLDGLDRAGLLRNALVVLLSDHGEGLFEHYLMDHNNSLYEELIHVPLYLRFPRGKYGGTRVGEVVQTVDVMPTVLDFLEIDPPNEIDGRSLMEACRAGRAVRRPALSTHGAYFSTTLWPYKLIVPRSTEPSVLYNLDEDPEETENVLDQTRPGFVDSLTAPLLELLRRSHHGAMLEVFRAESETLDVNLEGPGLGTAPCRLWEQGDQIRRSFDQVSVKLVPSRLAKTVLLLPHLRDLAARLPNGQRRNLAEGLTETGSYRLRLQRCLGEGSVRKGGRSLEIPRDLAARLRALGYAQ